MEDAHDIRPLFARAKKGEEEAKERLFTLMYTPLYRFILSRVGGRETAEDLTQDVFVRLYEALPTFEERGLNPMAFIYTIARNATIDFHKKKKAVRLEVLDLPDIQDDNAPHPEKEAIKGEDSARALSTLLLLREEEREIITLRVMGGLSAKETAHIVGKSEEAVRQMQSRALRKLRDTLTLRQAQRQPERSRRLKK